MKLGQLSDREGDKGEKSSQKVILGELKEMHGEDFFLGLGLERFFDSISSKLHCMIGTTQNWSCIVF